jgi:1,4-dihydroxy-2-naphthoyl-CoA hydrolase
MNTSELNRICKGTLIDLLDIEFTAFSDSTVEATMEIQAKHLQPMGFVHGGALLALAETAGSAGSFLLVDPERFYVFGSAVNGQHLAPAQNGTLFAQAKLTVKTDFKHVWDVEIKDDAGKLISISRVTNSVKPKNPEAAR